VHRKKFCVLFWGNGFFAEKPGFPHNHKRFQHISGLIPAYYFGDPKKPESVAVQGSWGFWGRFLLSLYRATQGACPLTPNNGGMEGENIPSPRKKEGKKKH